MKSGARGADTKKAYETRIDELFSGGKGARRGARVLYLDQKRSPEISERSGLQLPRDVRQLRGYKHRVLTEADLAKHRRTNSQNGPAFSKRQDQNINQAGPIPTGTTTAQVEQWVARVVSSWGDLAPRVQSMNDVPAEILEAAGDVLESGRFRAVEWNGSVYLVADAIKNRIEALKSLGHESSIMNATCCFGSVSRPRPPTRTAGWLRGLVRSHNHLKFFAAAKKETPRAGTRGAASSLGSPVAGGSTLTRRL